MTAMLDQLEQSGMIERRRSDQDRRQVIVTLTEAGHETLAAKRAKIEARTAEVLGPYSEAELDAAVRVMRSLVEILDSLEVGDLARASPLLRSLGNRFADFRGLPHLKMGVPTQCSASPARHT